MRMDLKCWLPNGGILILLGGKNIRCWIFLLMSWNRVFDFMLFKAVDSFLLVFLKLPDSLLHNKHGHVCPAILKESRSMTRYKHAKDFYQQLTPSGLAAL